ncbi:hypothetical protein WME94_29110 [Sorangium sp. So ce429]
MDMKTPPLPRDAVTARVLVLGRWSRRRSGDLDRRIALNLAEMVAIGGRG